MTTTSLRAHPFVLGLDQMDRLAERQPRKPDGFPPYDIEHRAPDGFRITLAVAGFSEDDLAVTLENRQLVIRGRQSEATDRNRLFLYRGIAGRAFQRSFVLADGVEVTSARLDDGLLHVDLCRRVPDQTVQTIKIDKG